MIEAFWAEFEADTGIDGPYEAWAFGDPSLRELSAKLALLVRDGPKRATAGLASVYDDGTEPMPKPGDLNLILDGEGAPVCVIRTTRVTLRRFGGVDEALAWDEGEGDRTLDWWRAGYLRFFESIGVTVDDDMMMMLERFELLWPSPASQDF